MRRWSVIPILLVVAIVVGLPLLALTDTGLEYDLRKAAGLETGECEADTMLDSPWSSGPSLPFKLDEPRGAALDGQIYVVGGITGLEELPSGKLLLEPSDKVLRLDPRTETYEELAPLPRALNHIGVVGYKHHLYVVGGYGRTLDTHTSKAFYRYDPVEDRWSRLPDMPEPQAAMGVAIAGNRLIVAGGARDNDPVSDAFAFDFNSGRWSRLPNTPERREHVGAAALDGDVFVLGGRSDKSWASTAAAMYEVSEGHWHVLPPMPVGSGGLAVVAAQGAVIALGGGNDAAGTVTGAVQKWDPSLWEWKLLPSMRTPRHGHTAVIAGGKIWVIGGSPCAYFAATDSVEWLPLSSLTSGSG